MHYVSATGLTKSYGITSLFQQITFHISMGDKIGLIARNGTGKSSLLKILAGKDNADQGELWIHKDLKVVFFEQEPVFDEASTILENIFLLDHPVLHTIKNYERIINLKLDEELPQVLVQMDEQNAWNFEAKVKEILGRLNIHHLEQSVGTLSGGQKKRVALAKALIESGFEERHTLMLLDEPTNHLDVNTVEWLESFLSKSNVTLVLVTHDRYFLDNITNVIWELDQDALYTYKGDYAYYLEKKAARLDSEAAELSKNKNTFRKELEWMRKQPKARTTKSKSREDNFYDLEQKVKNRKKELQLTLEMKMNRLGGKVLELKVVRKTFGNLNVLDGFTYTFTKGERVGIIGPNGVGKSTFLNMLTGSELPDSGKINLGDTVVIGYYTQQGLTFKEDVRVIEYVKSYAESFPLAGGGSLSATQFLELFLFPPDKQFTFLSKLSGGEKKRLLLLSILFTNPNFLILDEPTNDLDLPTLEVLEQFLLQYQGCILVVSHDRYFMDKLVDHLFVFEGNGIVSDFPGNYSEYRVLSHKNENTSKDERVKPVVQEKSEVQKVRMSYKEKREFESLEKEIEQLTDEKNNLTQKLMQNLPYDEIQSISNRISELEVSIPEKEMRWLELSELEL